MLPTHPPQVVFKWSEYENLYRGIFQERATMHSKVYTHRCGPLHCAGGWAGLGDGALAASACRFERL